jgi:hypothetical protein
MVTWSVNLEGVLARQRDFVSKSFLVYPVFIPETNHSALKLPQAAAHPQTTDMKMVFSVSSHFVTILSPFSLLGGVESMHLAAL